LQDKSRLKIFVKDQFCSAIFSTFLIRIHDSKRKTISITTPSLAETSATEKPRSVILRTTSSLNSGRHFIESNALRAGNIDI